MGSFDKHIFHTHEDIRSALIKLNDLAADNILFVVDDNKKLIGSFTDGDLRRGFIKGLGFDDNILEFVNKSPIFLTENQYSIDLLKKYRENNIKLIPIVNIEGVIVDVINFRTKSTLIPADALLMAGGEGKRLRPLTETTPKPLLKVGGKPIIEYNIDSLARVGVNNINLSINYLGDQIVDYFGNGSNKDINIKYVREEKPLGTIGSILLFIKSTRS